MPLIEVEHEEPDVKNNAGLVFSFKMYSAPTSKFEFDGSFNYLTSGRLIKIDTSEIPRLISEGAITPSKQTVKALNFIPDLKVDGFEVHSLPDSIQSILSNYKKTIQNLTEAN
ncbi:hypothetical protein [Legionella shakespearei]|uniref:Uncharacterized protein n=1 Tax=Legionella shakespearei DSM 23087 TaxID=1122169 RepID=A0A0W0YWA7_9GAMM|nr:hypothetical protein [Legionella shakespearei]KTD60975.1 hypothetical protein Lsha_1386 [Legionella shakespearei DSM 23087]